MKMLANLGIVALMLSGCTRSDDEKAKPKEGCVKSAPDVTSVWISPSDMTTNVRRALSWDDAANEVAFREVEIEVHLHNYARTPDEDEIQDVLSRTELLTWPAEDTIDHVTEFAPPRGRGSVAIRVRPEVALEDGWYALKIAESAGFAAEGADARGPGRGHLSRFHVGSCPLVLGVESFGDLGTTRLVLSEVLDGSSLRSLSLASLDGQQHCRPRFSTEGLLSPGKRLVFECDFAPAEIGVRVHRDRSSGIVLPKGPELRAHDFEESRGSMKTSRLAPLVVEAMPSCDP